MLQSSNISSLSFVFQSCLLRCTLLIPRVRTLLIHKTDLQGSVFKTAKVSKGTWILYTYPNYNDAQKGGISSNYKILKEGDEGDISSVNGSMYLVRDDTDGYILFHNHYYGGLSRKVRVATVKPRLNRKTSPRYVTRAGICFRVTEMLNGGL